LSSNRLWCRHHQWQEESIPTKTEKIKQERIVGEPIREQHVGALNASSLMEEQPDYVDRTVRQYQPNTSIRSEPGVYTYSWVLQPTELVVDNWKFAVSSCTQTTKVKVKYCPSRQIFVQARTSHATPSKHCYTWTDPQEFAFSSTESDESTDGKPKAIANNTTNPSGHQTQENLESETTEEELEAWTLPSEITSKKLKKHPDKDPEAGAGLGPVGAAGARNTGPIRTKYLVCSHHLHCA
jgi:hypothetical protein